MQRIRPDLTDNQAWEVLSEFERAACNDCTDPMYETMQDLADMSYPKG